MYRIGLGYDIHRLVKNRKLFIGGVQIPSSLGLDGHSDADLLIHSICDSILGALAKGDIGTHFSNTDPKYKNRKRHNVNNSKSTKKWGYTRGAISCISFRCPIWTW